MAVFARAWASPATSPNGGGVGDGALFLWFLRWTPYALLEGQNPLLGTHLNVPDGVNLMWNTSLPLPAALMTPVTELLGLPVTVTTLYTLALALSAWFASIAFRRYARSYPAALLGGLVYGFSPAMMAQSSSHLHLTLGAVLPPLLLLLLDELLVRQRHHPLLVGAALGALAAAQVLIGEELLAFTGIAAAAMVVTLLVMFPRQVPARAGRALLGIGAAVVFAALAAWPLAFQFLGPQRVAGDIQESSRNGNDLYSFVVPTRLMAVSPAAALQVSGRFIGRVGELNGYMGIPLVGLVLFTVARWWRSGVVRVAFITGLVMLLLSMGERLHVDGQILDVPMPWAAMKSLPLVESAIPTRMMLTANLFFGLLLAVFVDRSRRWAIGGRLLALVLVGAALVALLPKAPLRAQPLAPPPFFTGSEVRRIPAGSVALVAPFPTAQASKAMTWQALAGMRYRMPGGYFVGPDAQGRPKFGPVGTKLSGWMTKIRLGWDKPNLVPELRRALVADLARWQVGTVVVGPMDTPPIEATMVQFLTGLLGRPPNGSPGSGSGGTCGQGPSLGPSGSRPGRPWSRPDPALVAEAASTIDVGRQFSTG